MWALILAGGVVMAEGTKLGVSYAVEHWKDKDILKIKHIVERNSLQTKAKIETLLAKMDRKSSLMTLDKVFKDYVISLDEIIIKHGYGYKAILSDFIHSTIDRMKLHIEQIKIKLQNMSCQIENEQFKMKINQMLEDEKNELFEQRKQLMLENQGKLRLYTFYLPA